MSTMIIAIILQLFSTQVFVVASGSEELLQSNNPLALNLLEPLFTPNESLAPANISLGTNFDIQCDWQKYGFINTANDCESAWRLWSQDAEERTWVPRGRPQRHPDAYALPLMTMGLEARCYFELTLKSGRSISHAKLVEIRTASAALTQTCVVNKGISQGGIARSPGGDNNLNLIITEYQPKAQCSGPGSFSQNQTKLAACASILEIMDVSQRPIIFGPIDDPATQCTTPFLIVTQNNECGLAIESSQQIDSASWHKLWQETNAIFSRCLRKGEGGFSERLGDHDRISITMGHAGPDFASNVSVGTIVGAWGKCPWPLAMWL